MDSIINEFDILICFAGVKTKEGQDFINCIERVELTKEIYRVFSIKFENNSWLYGDFLSYYRFDPSFSKMAMGGKVYREYPLYTVGTPEYWREFRKVVKDVASFYEF